MKFADDLSNDVPHKLQERVAKRSQKTTRERNKTAAQPLLFALNRFSAELKGKAANMQFAWARNIYTYIEEALLVVAFNVSFWNEPTMKCTHAECFIANRELSIFQRYS